MRAPIQMHVCTFISDADDSTAVMLVTGRASFSMSIAEARQLSLEIARAADEAEVRVAEQQKERPR